MGFFPDNSESPRNSGTSGGFRDGNMAEQLRSKFPPGSDEYKAADGIVALVKKAHAVIRAVFENSDNPKEAFRAAEEELRQYVRDMGVKDEVDVLALTSVIAGYAIMIPPTAYGEDYNEWGR